MVLPSRGRPYADITARGALGVIAPRLLSGGRRPGGRARHRSSERDRWLRAGQLGLDVVAVCDGHLSPLPRSPHRPVRLTLPQARRSVMPRAVAMSCRRTPARGDAHEHPGGVGEKAPIHHLILGVDFVKSITRYLLLVIYT